MAMKRINEWGREHPWFAAAISAVIIFCAQMIFGTTFLSQDAAEAFPYAATYSATFSLLTGAINSYRRRRGE